MCSRAGACKQVSLCACACVGIRRGRKRRIHACHVSYEEEDTCVRGDKTGIRRV